MSNRIINGANIAYDWAVLSEEDPDLLPLIFAAYNQGRIWDIQIAEQLNAIYDGMLGLDPRTGKEIRNRYGKPGRYSLEFCAELRLGIEGAKGDDFWRTRYALLAGIPLDLWPAEAMQYPLNDSRTSEEITITQLSQYFQGKFHNIGNMPLQCKAAFCLHLGSVWGIRTDPDRINTLSHKVEAAHLKYETRYKEVGFIRPDGTEDTSEVKRAVAIAYGAVWSEKCPRCGGAGKVPSLKTKKPVICKAADGGCDGTTLDITRLPGIPLTDKGGISTSRDTLTESGDENLEEYAANQAEKIRDTYLPYLRQGLQVPINPRANVLLNTGRTSYDGVIQLVPKKGEIRECFLARPGYVFISADYAAIQLCTFAQICLWIVGRSKMADTINRSGNPGMLHTEFGARLAGISIEEMIKLVKEGDAKATGYRESAKAGNFGFFADMGAAAFVSQKRKANEGSTIGPDGRVYAGLRFCIMIGGEPTCGVQKLTEWKKRPIAPMCKKCLEIVEHLLKPEWFKQWDEARPYLDYIKSYQEQYGMIPSFGPGVDRIRGNVSYTQAGNNGPQALESDGVKSAFCAISEEAHTIRDSPLWGTHPIFLGHDDIFSEAPETRAAAAAARKIELMISEMQAYVPDITGLKVEASLMYRWAKGAKPKYNNERVLIPWDSR